MQWQNAIRTSLDYIEAHLTEDIQVQDIADQARLSAPHFQRGFFVMTGYSVSEYIRNRRLYQAALALGQPGQRVIDVAFDYGYDTPDSFTKAFTRFHGVTPMQVKQGSPYRTFLPLHIRITMQGGEKMAYQITKLFGFRVIGFAREIPFDGARNAIAQYWGEICARYAANVYAGNPPANPQEQALVDNCIGEFGICIDEESAAARGAFRYMIAGRYAGGEIPEGMTLYTFEPGEWAVFDCVGPIPDALQALNTRIVQEWLPGNPDYRLFGNASVEWYDTVHGEKTDADYHSAIWIPIKRNSQ